jgi:hypothetical protein
MIELNNKKKKNSQRFLCIADIVVKYKNIYKNLKDIR